MTQRIRKLSKEILSLSAQGLSTIREFRNHRPQTWIGTLCPRNLWERVQIQPSRLKEFKRESTTTSREAIRPSGRLKFTDSQKSFITIFGKVSSYTFAQLESEGIRPRLLSSRQLLHSLHAPELGPHLARR
jgi:hypothetical protein